MIDTQKNIIKLFEAVQRNDLLTLRDLLGEQPELVNATDEYNHTPLFDALFYEHLECAKIMLTDPVRSYIDASIIDGWGKDPYDIVLENKRLAELAPLLKPIFSPDYKSNPIQPVVYWAYVYKKHVASFAIISVLVFSSFFFQNTTVQKANQFKQFVYSFFDQSPDNKDKQSYFALNKDSNLHKESIDDLEEVRLELSIFDIDLVSIERRKIITFQYKHNIKKTCILLVSYKNNTYQKILFSIEEESKWKIVTPLSMGKEESLENIIMPALEKRLLESSMNVCSISNR